LTKFSSPLSMYISALHKNIVYESIQSIFSAPLHLLSDMRNTADEVRSRPSFVAILSTPQQKSVTCINPTTPEDISWGGQKKNGKRKHQQKASCIDRSRYGHQYGPMSTKPIPSEICIRDDHRICQILRFSGKVSLHLVQALVWISVVVLIRF
jgi:hypothetical protein